ncbi:hypothetical protein QBC39DRAFT_413256 [Podospora conica]|nr:hypothetical protein QBC39DRAFT_413256 [Schizothecium conicum]
MDPTLVAQIAEQAPTMTTWNPRATLMGLPLELRREIIFDVIETNTREAPARPPNRGVQYARRVRIENDPFPNPAMSLLLTSKQLHQETVEAQESNRFRSQPVRCFLDVMLYPTWLYVPRRDITHIDELHVQFRLFKAPVTRGMSDKDLDHGMFRAEGGIAGIIRVFYQLAWRVLKLGPCDYGKTTVGRLVFDFLPVAGGDAILPLGPTINLRIGPAGPSMFDLAGDFFKPYLGWANRPHNWRPPGGLLPAAMMLGFVRCSMDIFLLGEERRVARGDANLVRRIGEVEYRLDGVIQELELERW